MRLRGKVRSAGVTVACFLLAMTAGTQILAAPVQVQGATDLAGNPIGDYPHFKYTRAFFNNLDQQPVGADASPIHAAIDPRRFKHIKGNTCDVYVVSARTDAVWSIYPDLTTSDARTACPAQNALCTAGAPPCRCTFPADKDCPSGKCTIDDMTFVLADPGTLSSDSDCASGHCLGVGAGYDVVLDCGNGGFAGPNGVLDASDYIDGLGGEAGMYVVRDTVESTSLPRTVADYELSAAHAASFSINVTQRRQRTFFPTGLIPFGPLPLIVVSHGFGHEYDYYDYLMDHLASYGYVVMSHQNDVNVQGSSAAAAATIAHVDAFLAALDGETDCSAVVEPDTLCALSEKIDRHRIVLMGHSKGGEGAIIAYNRVADGLQTPDHFEADSIRLLVGLAPPDNRGGTTTPAEPRDKPFHLFYGSADTCVGSHPQIQTTHPFHLFERATGVRHSTYIHGVGHNYFHDNCCPGPAGCDASPDCPAAEGDTISESETHRIVKGTIVPVVKRYLEGDVASHDFLWRPYDLFRPLGAPRGTPPGETPTNSDVRVVQEYDNGLDPGRFVVDDYEEQPGQLRSSSSGGPVHPSVSNTFEGLMHDADCTYEWNAAGFVIQGCPDLDQEPMNGMTRVRATGSSHGVVFDWDANVQPSPSYTWEVISSEQDFTDNAYLSFRVAQMTRHPFTVGTSPEKDFTVSLTDANGARSSIRFGAYADTIGIPPPRRATYQCFGCPATEPSFGWFNEFETKRIRIDAFRRNGAPIDLSRIASVRFEFGGRLGADRGRIAIDDLELSSTDLPRCPDTHPCNGQSCIQDGPSLESANTGLERCVDGAGQVLSCGNQRLHVVTYGCAKAACCSEDPACICQNGACPDGTYLECR